MRQERPNFWEYRQPDSNLTDMALWYRLAADLVVMIHAADVLFVVFGSLLTVAGSVAGWE